MKHYIAKDALVAEIEKRRKDWHYGNSTEAKYKREECDDILSLIDTLEVKEVEESVNEDLEKVANYKFDDIEEKWRDIIDTYPDADVFIEKTWEWLKEIVAYYTENESTFEDFRKYIKGE